MPTTVTIEDTCVPADYEYRFGCGLMVDRVTRSIKRRRIKALPINERPETQQVSRLVRGGYEVLHHTKGWRRYSNKRAALYG